MIAEKLSPLILVIMYALYFINYPLSKLLDKMFGEHESHRFKKDELKTLIELHKVTNKGDHN